VGRKISDGQSVRVTAGAGVNLVQGNFYVIQGHLGMAAQALPALAVPAARPAILTVEKCEYETSQVNAGAVFANVGDRVYFDPAAQEFTDVALGNMFAGFITSPRDVNGVIWLLFAPSLSPVAGMGAAVVDVAAVDGVDAAGAAPDKAEFDVVVALANETKARLNALLASLRAAGLISP
jgi:hypothetical protein